MVLSGKFAVAIGTSKWASISVDSFVALALVRSSEPLVTELALVRSILHWNLRKRTRIRVMILNICFNHRLFVFDFYFRISYSSASCCQVNNIHVRIVLHKWAWAWGGKIRRGRIFWARSRTALVVDDINDLLTGIRIPEEILREDKFLRFARFGTLKNNDNRLLRLLFRLWRLNFEELTVCSHKNLARFLKKAAYFRGWNYIWSLPELDFASSLVESSRQPFLQRLVGFVEVALVP